MLHALSGHRLDASQPPLEGDAGRRVVLQTREGFSQLRPAYARLAERQR